MKRLVVIVPEVGGIEIEGQGRRSDEACDDVYLQVAVEEERNDSDPKIEGRRNRTKSDLSPPVKSFKLYVNQKTIIIFGVTENSLSPSL